MAISRVGVIGAGTMGQGIAQACAQSGLSVVLQDLNHDLVSAGVQGIGHRLKRLAKRDRLDEQDLCVVLSRIRPAVELSELADADMVIEAATENPQVKLELFAELGRTCSENTLLASNTSSISLTMIAGASGWANQVIGMHFFNPVPAMRLVEVIRALQTDDTTFAATADLARTLGKEPILVQDSPGFVVNRMLVPMINEAAYMRAENLASAEDIDAAMRLGAHHPMGPLALADLIGVDVCLYVMEMLYREFSDSKYRPCPMLRKMVDAGYLGRKSGRGFHRYE